jgi:hypothetical protein
MLSIKLLTVLLKVVVMSEDEAWVEAVISGG